MWGFDAFADGLSTAAKDSDSPDTAAPPQQLHKHYRNNDLFDAGGKLLDAETAHHATTWRSHHAFSGRCALVSPIAAADQQQQQRRAFHVPAWAEQSWSAYQSWSAGFRLRSVAADEPHILLSIAPAYFPNLVSATGDTREADAATLASLPCPPSAEEEAIYHHRVLETPLIWEEPYALSLECTPHGLFLWSDQWGIFGKKVADRCLEVRSDPSVSPGTGDAAVEGASSAQPCFAAALRLHWRAGAGGSSAGTPAAPTQPTLTVELQTVEADAATTGSTTSVTTERGGNAVWQQVIELPLPLDGVSAKAAFRPYVTLMEGGDSVELL